ncbi:hypothetical protein [Kitasatospora cheerisanensis]|uniref:Uncharacterized protein n=1 Tax=Kitasatospora cheerisanensis KCTC 2395 TaxID=1348663 RepID=A0A066Z2G9_9ACTN|nr:hypothetical protein [Kitasatospora cheerisanensis]KDN87978.1 hypothetical protein KCH_02700 [Kitasatospora cheerisanensis KCTC 2395]
MTHRYWCDECGHRTPRLDAADAERRLLEHYAAHHPEVAPGGQVETGRGLGGCACLGLTALLLLLAVVVAAYRH